jgi:phosphate starvation-inducible PhoH-like protein
MPLASRQVQIDAAATRTVFGVRDSNLQALGRATGAELSARGNTVTVQGTDEAADKAVGLVTELAELVADGVRLKGADLEVAARLVVETPRLSLRQILIEQAVHPTEGRRVLARTSTQSIYLEAVRRRDIVFGIGPAGTGKTFLAVALALQHLQDRSVRRIVLTRPAVEAGERLGFLPGDLVDKVDPYLRPLHDALHDLSGPEQAASLFERGQVEVAPLAFMRGRTLNESFIILDEAQNTTPEQMKMFLTRMGLNSKVVVTGDITQVDLPHGRPSGLVEAARILKDVEGIEVIRFGRGDVVRHDLVMKIVQAYEREGARSESEAGPDAAS